MLDSLVIPMSHLDSLTNGDSAPATRTIPTLEQASYLHAALEKCGIAVFEIDFRTGIVSYVSDLCADKQNLTPAGTHPISAEDTWKFVDPRDAPWMAEVFAVAAKRARPHNRIPVHYCYRRLRADGTPYWTEEWATASFDANAQPIKYAGINVDISERRESEERLQQALEAKDKYLRLIVHDIRNPLTVLNSYLYLMMQTNVAPERQADMLARMKRAVESIKHLADEIMKLESEAHEHATVNPLILDARTWLEDFCIQNRTMGAAKDIEIEWEIPDHPIPIWMDPEAMERVMTNLLSNSVKYSYPTSTVLVKLLPSDQLTHATFSISDQGVGIPPEKLRYVFEPFYTTGARPTGGEQAVGLGLAVCKTLVQAQGGRIWAESGGEGQGSTFFVQMSTTTPTSDSSH